MDIDNAEYGWHHQTAIIKLKDEYKARAERAEAALRTLVEAANKVTMRFLIGYTADEANGLLDLYEALEQARAALPSVNEQEVAPPLPTFGDYRREAVNARQPQPATKQPTNKGENPNGGVEADFEKDRTLADYAAYSKRRASCQKRRLKVSNSNLASDASADWERDSPCWKGEWAIVSESGARALLLTEQDSMSQGQISDMDGHLDGNLCRAGKRVQELQAAGDRMLAALNWQLSLNNQGFAPLLDQIQEFGKVLARGQKERG